MPCRPAKKDRVKVVQGALDEHWPHVGVCGSLLSVGSDAECIVKRDDNGQMVVLDSVCIGKLADQG